jgi:parallel beta-helix repeat protein
MKDDISRLPGIHDNTDIVASRLNANVGEERMRRVSLIVAGVVFTSTLFTTITTLPQCAMGVTHYVGGGGPGNYSSIQEAIDNASTGDTIFIYNGSYSEHVLVNKSVSLLGEDKDTVTIDGGGVGIVVNVSSDWVNITSLGVTNGGSSLGDAGMALHHVRDCDLTDLRIVSNDRYGVLIFHSDTIRLVNSTMSFNKYGALLWSSNRTTVAGNSIFGNEWQGLYVFESFGVTVTNNTVSQNIWGGITLYSSHDGVLKDNIATSNRNGIALLLSNNSSVRGNTLLRNEEGISLDSSNHNLLEENTLQQNLVGIRLESSVSIEVANNTMVEDGFYIEGESIEHWNTHVVEASNTVNGNPLLFWKNRTGGMVDSPAGQVILANCTGVVVRNQSISNAYVGMELGFSSGNTLMNNSFQFIHWIGILAYGSDGNSISDTILTSGGWAGIHLDVSNYTTLESINVSDKRYGIHVWDCVDTVISESIVSFSTHGISLEQAENSEIVNNTVTANEYGISLHLSDYNLLASQEMSDNDYGVHMSWSDQNEMVGNDVRSSVLFGSSLEFSLWNVISANRISNGTAAVGLFRSSSNTLSDNIVHDNLDGFLLNRSDKNIIDGNTICMNADDGIHLTSSSSNTIANNTIDTNGKNGILVFSSGSNIVTLNDIQKNPEGLGLYSSGFNLIYHNSFANNTVQAVDNTSNNEWDSGYPVGGNYWSDYMGNDSYLGPDQNIPGSDGIGDGPYMIDIDSTDRYPLIHPYGSVYPGAPTNLRASLIGFNLRDVRIHWNHSTSGGPVMIYEVYRSDSYRIDGFNYTLIGSVSNWSNSYLDHLAGEGNPESYFYVICALDFFGLRSCPANQASKFTRPLAQGPNLVSLPLIQFDESFESVLQTVKYDRAWFYDHSSQEWKWFMKNKDYRRGLWMMNHTMGIWVNVIENSNLTVAGVVPAQTSIHLRNGWNLVGFPSFNATYTVADLKVEIGVTRVEGMETMPPFPPSRLRVLADLDALQAGYGYWVRVDADTDWIVKVS